MKHKFHHEHKRPSAKCHPTFEMCHKLQPFIQFQSKCMAKKRKYVYYRIG